jgi:hypothetical protein
VCSKTRPRRARGVLVVEDEPSRKAGGDHSAEQEAGEGVDHRDRSSSGQCCATRNCGTLVETRVWSGDFADRAASSLRTGWL